VLAFPDMSMGEIVESGGQRISVGSQLTWVAVAAFAAAAERLHAGDFSALAARVRLKDWLATED
jgi:hypothetical protein